METRKTTVEPQTNKNRQGTHSGDRGKTSGAAQKSKWTGKQTVETGKKTVEPQENRNRQGTNQWKQGKNSGATKQSATPQILLEGF